MNFNELTQRDVDKFLKKPDSRKLGDGANLYIQRTGSYIFRFRDSATKKIREIGLGSSSQMTLADARTRRDALNASLRNGEPIVAARVKRLAGGGDTFGTWAQATWETATRNFKTEKDRTAWMQSLETYAKGLWSMPVNAINVLDIADTLKPIWHDKQATARHVRARIARVFTKAISAGVRKGINPAEFKFMVEQLGDQNGKTAHRAMVALADLPGVLGQVRAVGTVAALALEFVALTAARVNEVLSATWSEVSGDVWTVPLAHMKTGKKKNTTPHKVPLSARALEILAKVRGNHELIFSNGGDAINEKTILRLLQKFAPGATTHGLRAAFKEWALAPAQLATFNDADLVSEFALSHKVENESKGAYIRTAAFEARVPMMESWSKFLGA